MILRVGDSSIRLPNETDPEVLAALREAKVFKHSEFVYTGSSRAGQNHDNGGQEAFLREAGLWADEVRDEEEWSRNSSILYNLSSETGIEMIEGNGRRLTYHCQQREGVGHGHFGYTWRAEYRIIRVEVLS